jgi:hypothetical protein
MAKAYDSLKSDLCNFCYEQYENSPELFSPAKGVISSRSEWEGCFLSSIKDFQVLPNLVCKKVNNFYKN